MADIYTSGAYLDHNPTWHEEDSAWKARQIAELVERHAIAPKRVIEVGCGAGGVLHRVADALDDDEATYDGYDIAPKAIERAQAIEPKRCRFHCGDPLAEPPAEPYDLLLAIDVFEHVPDYMGFLRQCQRTARYKIYHVPLDMTVSAVLRERFDHARANIGHLHYFTPRTAIATLEDTGHRIVDQVFTAGALDLFRTHPSVKRAAANVPRWLVSRLSVPLATRLFGGWSLLILAE